MLLWHLGYVSVQLPVSLMLLAIKRRRKCVLNFFTVKNGWSPMLLIDAYTVPVIPFSCLSLLKIGSSPATAFRDELPLGWGGWPLIDHQHSSLNHC